MWPISLIINAIIICAGAASARPGWHLDEFFPLATEQLDTIVSPNAQSSHMHRIFGSSAFKAAFNFDDSRKASCTSIAFQADMSNYWMPQLYWIDDSGPTKKYAPLQVTSRVYYFMTENTAKSNVTVFPDGLRILAGNPNAKSDSGVYNFSCQRNRNLTDIVQGPDFNFDMDCPNGLKTNLYYQSCWNGKDLWLPGNAHMSYTYNGNPRNGPCPWSHPIRLPSMMLEAVWLPGNYAPGQSLKGHLTWANGDTTGYGFHGDFTNGWDRDVFQRAMASPACVGQNDQMPMSACPVFAESMDSNKARACRPTAGTLIESTGVVENAPISALPGCNPLWASGSKPTCSPAVAGLDVSKLLGTNGPLVAKAEQQMNLILPTEPGWKRLGCIAAGGLTTQISYTDGALTQDRCTETCLESGYNYAAVGNHADTCYCGKGINPSVQHQEGMCTVKCPGNSTQTCGAEYIVDVFYAPPGTQTNTAGKELTGCYSPSGSGDMRKTAFYSFLAQQMTKDVCLQACVNRNSTWAMITASVNCFCGNTVLDQAVQTGGNYVPMSSCDRACPGNSSQSCGGQYVGSLYNLTASAVSVDLPVKPPGWLGCYDGGSNAVNDVTWLSDTLEPQDCTNQCSELGYKYSAVSVGNRCQCGNSNTLWRNRLPASQCNTPCRGNSSITCGSTYNTEIYDVVVGADYSFPDMVAKYPSGWMGCFASTGGNLQLTSYSFTSTSLTAETCKSGCAQFGYPYAGMQNKNTCRCGPAPTSRRMPHENCNFPCTGNSTQFCGSTTFMDVYNATAVAVGGSTSPSAYVGCYQDQTNPRGLSSYQWNQDGMTIDMCRSSCLEVGPYALAGLQSGNTCFCGNKWSSGSILPESSCSVACKGNSSQICGGNSISSVYNTTSAPLAESRKPAGWQGCYPNSYFSAAYYGSSSLSSATCRASCGAQGYTFAAMRSGNICYCGSTLPARTTRSPAPNCYQPCSGNSTETCGAPYLVDVYTSTGTSTPEPGYLGCFSDPSKTNAISYTSNFMTRDTCNQYCQARSYAFAMTAYGNRCWCGNSRPVQRQGDSACNSACTGQSNTTCGGSNLGGLFSLNGANVNAAIAVVPDSKGYVGCFAEGSTKLSTLKTTLATNTPALCQSTCKGLGFKLSGTENGNQCYCSNELAPLSGGYRISDGDCSSACAGDASLKCGGSNKLSVMVTSTSTGAATSNGQEGNIGCYQTGNVITNAQYTISMSPMSTQYCRRTCRVKGYSAAFLTNGNQCVCGSASDAGSEQPSTMCNTACASTSGQKCGSSTTVSLYDTTGAGSLPPVMSQPGYVGCFYNNNPSAFTFSSYNSANTLQLCSRLCATKNAAVWAVSGIDCHCGSTIPYGMRPDAECTTTCPGAGSTDKCGGSSRFSVFSVNSTLSAASASSIASTSVATSTRASSSVAPSSVASSAARVSSVASSSMMTTIKTSSTASTSSRASSSASVPVSTTSRASSAAATTTLKTTSAAATSKPASSAATSRTGSSTLAAANGIMTGLTSSDDVPVETRQSVVLATTSTTGSAAAAPAASSDAASLGCFAVNREVMSGFTMSCSTLDPSMCKLLCRYKGFAYAAVTNGDTCLCGSSTTGLHSASATSCNSACTGDAQQTCGGSDSMQVLHTNEVTLPAMVVSRSRNVGNANANSPRKIRHVKAPAFVKVTSSSKKRGGALLNRHRLW